jgi:hypothetical protein
MPSALITFLLDKSYSMTAIKAATIEAFNGYLTGLQAERDAEIDFTFLLFDSISIDKVCVAEPVAKVPLLTNASYQPRGGTPLIDAAVATIQAVDASLASRSDNPRVVICIQTDGEENQSSLHTWEELRGLITTKQAAGWQFNFLGAGIDAYQQAAKMGVAATSTMSYNSADAIQTKAAFAASASNTTAFAAARSDNTAYTIAQRTASGDAFAAHAGLGVPGQTLPAQPVQGQPAPPSAAGLVLTKATPAAKPAAPLTL